MQRFLSFLSVIGLFVALVPVSTNAQSTYDVSLVQDEPVYSWIDARYTGGFGGAPFTGIQALPSNHFIISGKCNYGQVTVDPEGNLFGDGPGLYPPYRSIPHEAGGMYVLNSSGNHIGTRNVCYDTALRRACAEGGGCSNDENTIPLGGTQFLRMLHPQSFGIPRSPTVYNAVSGIPQLAQIFFNNFSGGGGQSTIGVTPDPLDESDYGRVISVETGAVANGVLIGYETEYEAPRIITDKYWVSTGDLRQTNGQQNGFYYPQTLSRFAESVIEGPFDCYVREPGEPLRPFCSGAPAHSVAPFGKPIVGVGSYFFTRSEGYSSFTGLSQLETYLFEMPSISEIVQGERPELVEGFDFPHRTLSSFAVDPTNSNRIAIAWGDQSIRIYEAGSNGLNELYRIDPLDSAPGANWLNIHRTIALMGDYLSYTQCDSRGSSSFAGTCTELKVYKNGEELTTEPIPIPGVFARNTQLIYGTSITPDGHIAIIVQARGNSSQIDPEEDHLFDYAPQYLNGAIVLYKIGGATSGGGPTGEPVTIIDGGPVNDDPAGPNETGFNDPLRVIPNKTIQDIYAQYGLSVPANSPYNTVNIQQQTGGNSEADQINLLKAQIQVVQQQIQALINQ